MAPVLHHLRPLRVYRTRPVGGVNGFAEGGLDVGGVAAGHVGFRHEEGGSYSSVQEGEEPLLLLLGCAVVEEDFGVARVGGAAVARLGGEEGAAHAFAEDAVFAVPQRQGRRERPGRAGSGWCATTARSKRGGTKRFHSPNDLARRWRRDTQGGHRVGRPPVGAAPGRHVGLVLLLGRLTLLSNKPVERGLERGRLGRQHRQGRRRHVCVCVCRWSRCGRRPCRSNSGRECVLVGVSVRRLFPYVSPNRDFTLILDTV